MVIAVSLPLRSQLHMPVQSRKMHWLEKLIKSACKCLLSVSKALEREIHSSNELTSSNQHQTAVLSFLVLISGVHYFVIRSSSVCLVFWSLFYNEKSKGHTPLKRREGLSIYQIERERKRKKREKERGREGEREVERLRNGGRKRMRKDKELREKKEGISRPGWFWAKEELSVGGERGGQGKSWRHITVAFATACLSWAAMWR